MTPFFKKIHRKPEQAILILEAPNELKPILISDGVHFDQKVDTKYAFLILFCYSKSDIDRFANQVKTVAGTSSIWIAYPKKSGKISTDLSRDHGWEAILKLGLLPVTQIAIDENWSALRFRPKGEIKKMTRGTLHPNVDTDKKKVIIPPDLAEALDLNKCLHKFESLSFTNQKEAVLSVLGAKQAETRERRIAQIIKNLKS